MPDIIVALAFIFAWIFGIAAVVVALIWFIGWIHRNPVKEPVYSSAVRYRASIAPKVIIVLLALAWLAAQYPAIEARFF